MKNIIQLFRQEPFASDNTEWHLLTQINFQIDGRKLYYKRKGTVELNPHFLYDRLNKIKKFNIYYLSAFTDIEDLANIDFDFQIGFNNFENAHEKEIISILASDKDLYLIVRPTTYGEDFSQLSSLFNEKSMDYIEDNYNVVYKKMDKLPSYLVKVDNIDQLIALDEYIYGYLIKTITNQPISLNKLTSFYELDVLDILMNCFESVILRTPLFANYNLTIFSRYLDFSSVRIKLMDYSQKMNIGLNEIDINSQNNLLIFKETN